MDFLVGAITGLGSSIINGFADILEFLFVPSSDIFDDLEHLISFSFPIISQVSLMWDALMGNFNFGLFVPSFDITYHGVTVSIIDFSVFLEYRTYVHSIIIAIAYFNFILRLIKLIPLFIRGL